MEMWRDEEEYTPRTGRILRWTYERKGREWDKPDIKRNSYETRRKEKVRRRRQVIQIKSGENKKKANRGMMDGAGEEAGTWCSRLHEDRSSGGSLEDWKNHCILKSHWGGVSRVFNFHIVAQFWQKQNMWEGWKRFGSTENGSTNQQPSHSPILVHIPDIIVELAVGEMCMCWVLTNSNPQWLSFYTCPPPPK